MSVAGGRSVFLDTALALDDKVVEDALKLPRNTLSAAPAHRRSRGLPAVLVSFDRKVQAALRRLCFERMTLEARLRAETERLESVEQNLMREPDVLNKIRVALADNEYNIRRLAGDATPQIIAALYDPEIRENLQLAVASEDDTATEVEARLWRRNLDRISIPVRVDQPYRYASHDSPTVKGHRDLHNDLNRRTGEEGLSYYQKQQLKYGKGRRGSTSIAGAWEQVFSEGGAAGQGGQADQGAQAQAQGIAMGMGGGMGMGSTGVQPGGPQSMARSSYDLLPAGGGGGAGAGRAYPYPYESSGLSSGGYGSSSASSAVGGAGSSVMGDAASRAAELAMLERRLAELRMQQQAQEAQVAAAPARGPEVPTSTPALSAQPLPQPSYYPQAQAQAQQQYQYQYPQAEARVAQPAKAAVSPGPAHVAATGPASPRQALGSSAAANTTAAAQPLPGTGAAAAAASSVAGMDPKLQELLSKAKAMLAAQLQ